MSEVKLSVETRTEFGKGASRRLRQVEKVPGVVYGHGDEPKHIVLDSHALMLALRTPNVLIRLDIDGGKSTELVPEVRAA